VAGLDGTGLLALVTAGATAEGIHLATLGYEVFVLHASQGDADIAEAAMHVHHVAAEATALPAAWEGRFALVVALDGAVPEHVVAPQGLVMALADGPLDQTGLTRVVAEEVQEGASVRVRTVLARL